MSLLPKCYRPRPFVFRRDADYLDRIADTCAADGCVRGIFMDSSGNARIEPINPTAYYTYSWRSDGHIRRKEVSHVHSSNTRARHGAAG